jgi:hypothetical protein
MRAQSIRPPTPPREGLRVGAKEWDDAHGPTVNDAAEDAATPSCCQAAALFAAVEDVYKP